MGQNPHEKSLPNLFGNFGTLLLTHAFAEWNNRWILTLGRNNVFRPYNDFFHEDSSSGLFYGASASLLLQYGCKPLCQLWNVMSRPMEKIRTLAQTFFPRSILRKKCFISLTISNASKLYVYAVCSLLSNAWPAGQPASQPGLTQGNPGLTLG